MEESYIVANHLLTKTVGIVTLAAPHTAAAVRPGQFIHLLLPQMDAHILRRPYSVLDADAAAGTIDIMYQVVGVGSAALAQRVTGDSCNLIGPLGRGWHPPVMPKLERALLVCGGLGAAPLTLLARELIARGATVDVVIGARDALNLACHDRLTTCASTLHVATDDGSVGHKGFCTELSARLLAEGAYGYAAVCGPEPMERIVVGQLVAAGLLSEVSLERRMACGIGACLSCTVETRAGRRRACVDGPVFDAREVVWE